MGNKVQKIWTHAAARAAGYTVDENAAGRPCAYLGPRFNPILPVLPVYTELEERLMALLDEAGKALLLGFRADGDWEVETLLADIGKVLADV